MGDDDLDPRFHTWLRNRAPKAAPQGLLARSVAQLDNDSRQQGRGWPLLRASVLVPSFASLLVVALVAALVVINLPRAPRPIAEASESGSPSATTTAEVSASPTGAETATPSETPSATPTIAPTVAPTVEPTAVPTATPFPSPVPTPVPPIVGPPGTLTVRVTLASMPPGTTTISVGMMGPDGPVDPDPAALPNGTWELCGGQSGTPCDVPGVFEQRFSGLEPGAWIAVGIGARAPGEAGWTILRGQWRADGFLVAGRYPEAQAPTGPPRCSGNQWNRQDASGRIDAGTSFVAPADMCLTNLQWSFINRIPTTGTSTLLRDGVPIYVLPMADWAAGTYGTQGAGSGEKMVVLDAPIPIARGQTISLAFADCPTCVSEDVNVIATGALWP